MRDIGVLATVDSNYIIPLCVMLRSMGETLQTDVPLNVYVLHDKIPNELTERVAASLLDVPLTLHWIGVPESSIPATVNLVGYAGFASTYFRLLFDRFLPTQVRRVLYLDPDILVQANVIQLFAFRSAHPVAAVRIKPSLAEMIGFIPEERPDAKSLLAFNAGVMLIERDVWNEQDIGSRAVDAARRYGARFRHWDQDALNLVLANNWSRLPATWNYRPDPYGFPSWRADPEEPIYAPAIVHFAGSRKPWQPVSDFGETSNYFAALDRTMWRGWRPRRLGRYEYAWEVLAERGHRRIDQLRESIVKARRAKLSYGQFHRLIASEIAKRPWMLLTYPASRRGRTPY